MNQMHQTINCPSYINYILLRLTLLASTVTTLPYEQYYDQRNELFNQLELFEGDIMLTNAQRQLIYSGIQSYSAREGHHWPNGIIPYVFGTKATGARFEYTKQRKEKIKEAMRTFERNTCVKFVPKEKQHKYFINIRNKLRKKCSAHVGRCSTRECMKTGTFINLDSTSWCFQPGM